VRTLILGGTGFVGSHLAEAALAAGHEVSLTGRGALGSRLAGVSERVRFQPLEICDGEAVSELIRELRPDRVHHLAGFASQSDSFGAEEEVYRTNVLGTLNVLRAMRAHAPKGRLLVVGSGAEYGNVPEAQQPISESQPLAPASPYAVSRAASSLMALQQARSHGLWALVARTFNLVGPRQSRSYALADWAAQIARAARAGLSEVVVQTGDIDVCRDYSDVGDGVAAYLELLETGEPGRAYNVCSSRMVRLSDLLDGLGGAAGLRVHAVQDSARFRVSDLRQVCGDNSALRLATGLSFRPVEEALVSLVRYWCEQL